MSEPSPLRRWLVPTVWSVGLLAVVLVGSIVSVKMLSDRDAITLAGGIAVFAVSTAAWFAVTSAIWTRALRGRHRGAAGRLRSGAVASSAHRWFTASRAPSIR